MTAKKRKLNDWPDIHTSANQNKMAKIETDQQSQKINKIGGTKNTRKSSKINRIKDGSDVPYQQTVANAVRKYKCRYCDKDQFDITKARVHQTECFLSPQYIVQVGMMGYRRIDKGDYVCLFCNMRFIRADRLESHIRSKHSEYIDIQRKDDGEVAHIVNFEGRMLLFEKDITADKKLFFNFAMLPGIISKFNDDINSLKETDAKLLKQYADVIKDFDNKFATNEDLAQLRAEMKQQGTRITNNTTAIQENSAKIQKNISGMIDLNKKVDHIFKVIGKPALAPQTLPVTLPLPVTQPLLAPQQKSAAQRISATKRMSAPKPLLKYRYTTQQAWVLKLQETLKRKKDGQKIWATLIIKWTLQLFNAKFEVSSPSESEKLKYVLQKNSEYYAAIKVDAIKIDAAVKTTTDLICELRANQSFNVVTLTLYNITENSTNAMCVVKWLEKTVDDYLLQCLQSSLNN